MLEMIDKSLERDDIPSPTSGFAIRVISACGQEELSPFCRSLASGKMEMNLNQLKGERLEMDAWPSADRLFTAQDLMECDAQCWKVCAPWEDGACWRQLAPTSLG